MNILKKIHKHIFGDIYDWAGKERTIPIEKSEEVLNGLSVKYTDPDDIKKQASEIITKINKTNWSNMSIEQRAEEYAKNIAELWRTHVFREGNTRTTMTYACEFADTHGFPMNRELFAKNSGFTRKALVMASIDEYSRPEYLTRIFKDSMISGAKIVSTTKTIDPARYNKVIQDKNINDIQTTPDNTYTKA